MQFGSDGADAAQAKEFRDSNEQVEAEQYKFAHGADGTMIAIVCKTARHRQIPSYCEFATHRGEPCV